MAEVKICGACCGTICDRYIMRVADISYHERCLLCSICGIRLSHTCFTKDSKLYCRLDYDRWVWTFPIVEIVAFALRRLRSPVFVSKSLSLRQRFNFLPNVAPDPRHTCQRIY